MLLHVLALVVAALVANRPSMQSMDVPHVRFSSLLRIATWNCGGLTFPQQQFCAELGYDVLAITETHDKGAFNTSSRFIVADPAPDTDKAAGVALQLSELSASCLMHKGCIGSRIVFARIRAAVCNLFVIAIYVPHADHVNPSRETVLADLESLLEKVSPTDCVIILGDFNSKLPRSYEKLTGKWCIHKHADVYGGGEALLDVMRRHRLVAASTLHQPRRGHTNATFIPRNSLYKPSQIDYILCSKRWVSSVRSSRVRWGVSIQRWGRRFDHGLVECGWKMRLAAPSKVRHPDFSQLKNVDVAKRFDDVVSNVLSNNHIDPEVPSDRLARLNRATKQASETLPTRKNLPLRKQFVSDHTRELYQRRSEQYQQLSDAERRELNRDIKKSCRTDYRTYIDNIVGDIVEADKVGDTRKISKLTNKISSRPNAANIMPSKNLDGTPITSQEELLEAWQTFLGRKFACADRPSAAFAPGINDIRPEEDVVSWEEFEECVNALRGDRAAGSDEIPIEVYLASPSAKRELYEVLCLLWKTEDIPVELVRALFIMLYKKGSRDDFANYRAIGLLCHSYKVLSVLVLRRMQDALEQRLPDTQAGFRKARGCRDNVLILKHLMSEVLRAGEEAVVTFIDYTAAFDSLSHRFLDEALAEANVSPKVRRIIQAIYSSASGVVRIREASGKNVFSGAFSIDRGAIQGDIYSPPSFTIGLDSIFRRHDVHCEGVGGPPLNAPSIAKLEYADDVALPNKKTQEASVRLSAISTGGSADACLDMSMKKTKCMPVRTYEPVTATTEAEVIALKLQHKCPDCDRTFPTERGMNVHRSRWCDPDGPVRSRIGSLADKAVQLVKRKEQATQQENVFINGHQIDNVLQFEYLGCRVSGDGDESADVNFRMAIAQERFNSLYNIWHDHRVPRALKIALYVASVCSTFTHGCDTWTLKPPIVRKINGFNSRCLHNITGRTYREEAVSPTYNLVRAVRQRRMRWLGHILRMPADRLVRQTICHIAVGGPPFPAGSLLMDCNTSLHNLVNYAADRAGWEVMVKNIY